MSTFAPLGPIRPIKKPTPYIIFFMDNKVGFLDNDSLLEQGSELYTCIEAETPIYELVESGTYTTTEGLDVVVVDGIIQSVE